MDYCTFITSSSIPFSPSPSNTSRQSIGGYRYISLASNRMKMTDLFTCSLCHSRGRPARHSVLHLSIVSDCTLLKHDGTDRLDASDVLVANAHGFNWPVIDIGRDIALKVPAATSALKVPATITATTTTTKTPTMIKIPFLFFSSSSWKINRRSILRNQANPFRFLIQKSEVSFLIIASTETVQGFGKPKLLTIF